MKTLLLATLTFIALPLVAGGRLDQLDHMISQSCRNYEYHIALAHTKELLQVSKDKDDAYYMVRGYLIQGFIYSKIEEYGKAVLSYLEGARFAESSSEKRVRESLITIYKNLAVIMGDYKHYDLAHKFNQEGLEVAIGIDNEKQVLILLHNDGYDYVAEEKYDSAINIFNRILTDYNPDSRKKLGLANDLGLAYWNQSQSDKAIIQYELILNQRNSVKDAKFIAKVLHNMGLALMDKKEYERALTYFEEASEINTREGSTNTLFGNYKNIGKSWYHLGNKEKALDHYLKAATLFDETYVDPEDYDIFELIADYYFSENQPELAFRYEKRYNENLEAYIARQKEIAELDKKYNMELVTQRYFDILDAEERHQRTIRIAQWSVGGVTAVFLLIIGIYLYRYHRKRYEIRKAIKYIEDNSPV